MITVYLAGPFRGENAFAVNRNVQQAVAAMYELIEASRAAGVSVSVLCPHSMSQHFDHTFDDQYWLDATLELLRRLDVVLMLPGWEHSAGAKGERQAAEAAGKLVFDSVEGFLKWAVGVEEAAPEPVPETPKKAKKGKKGKQVVLPDPEPEGAATPVAEAPKKKRGPKPKVQVQAEADPGADPEADPGAGPRKRGRKPAAEDAVLEAIRQHEDNGTSWPEIHVPGCSGMTALRRWRQWQADGVWESLLPRLEDLRKNLKA